MNEITIKATRLADSNGNRVYQLEAGGATVTVTAPPLEAERQLFAQIMGRVAEFGLGATEPAAQ